MTERRRILIGALLATVVGFGLEASWVRRYGYGELSVLELIPQEEPRVAPSPPPLAPDLLPERPIARSLRVFFLDGLRVDAAESSRAWQTLASRGARIRVSLRFPVCSTPSRALFATQAPSEVTGIVGNHTKNRGTVDHLLARAAAHGIAVTTHFDWGEWLGLSPYHLDHPSSRELEITDWFEVDEAGHAHGAASPEYAAAVKLVSDRLLERVAAIDLERDAVIAVSDHGHIATGGHAGLEPEVAIAPALILGPRVMAGFERNDPVPMEDLGATAALLLGIEPPALGRGVPLVRAFDLPENRRTDLEAAAIERRRVLALAWESAVNPTRVILLRAIAALALVIAFAAIVRPALDRAFATALAGPALATAAFFVWRPSPSAHAGTIAVTYLYLIVYAVALLVSVAIAIAVRSSRVSFERATLLAWLLPVAAVLARFGLGPGGLAPDPLVFPSELVIGNWGCAGVTILLVELGVAIAHRARLRAL